MKINTYKKIENAPILVLNLNRYRSAYSERSITHPATIHPIVFHLMPL